MINIVSLSGGKDSTALWLWAIRAGLNPIAIYADTGWEWEGHSAYLDLLESKVGPIRRIKAPLGFAELTEKKGTFPSRVRKWCTEELKLKPFSAELDRIRDETGDEVTVLLGTRREESAKRKVALEREWSEFYDCEVWRPILDWTVADVAAEHHRAGIPLHPLYHEGAERVGCFPCVGESKAGLALVARLQPSQIDRIRLLEAKTGQTMFTRDRRAEKKRLGDDGPSVVPIGIDEVIAWANTKRGGKELQLERPRTGCARWGVCEAPLVSADSDVEGQED